MNDIGAASNGWPFQPPEKFPSKYELSEGFLHRPYSTTTALAVVYTFLLPSIPRQTLLDVATQLVIVAERVMGTLTRCPGTINSGFRGDP